MKTIINKMDNPVLVYSFEKILRSLNAGYTIFRGDSDFCASYTVVQFSLPRMMHAWQRSKLWP